VFEYHGEQHYKFNEFFHGTLENFTKRQEDDKKRREECDRLKIRLLEVPYFLVETDQQLLLFVQQFLFQVGLHPPSVGSVVDFFKDFYLESPQLKRIEKIIKEKGGKLLTFEYNGSKKTPITVECKHGHKWITKYATLTMGRWCPYCAGRSRDEEWLYQELKKLVETNELTLITPHYTPDREKIELKCYRGHVFKRVVNTLKGGAFSCPYCTGNLPREEKEKELRSFIEKKGGVLLSKYISNKVNVDIQCENGHVFSIRPNNLKSGRKQWCKYCNQQLKSELQQEVAEDFD
jgi:predicted SprT family Zn-dependent metalloprotease